MWNSGTKHGRTISLTLTILLTVGMAAAPTEAGKFRQLPEAAEVPLFAELLGAGSVLPRARYEVYLPEGDGRLVRLTLEEVGRGDPEELIVLIHGALSNRKTWRFLAGDLGQDHRLLLVDLLGSGESEKVDPADLGKQGYNPTAQARRVLQALRTFIAHRPTPTRRLTVVGHSLGGAVVLRLTGAPELRSEFGDVIERIDRVVLMASLDFAVEKADPTLVKIVGMGKVKAGLGNMLGLLRKEAAAFTLNAYVDSTLATRNEARKLTRILKQRTNRRPAQAQIAQAVPMGLKTRKPDWERIEALVDDYRNVTIPCLVVWGARDETLPLSMGYKLQAQLPDASLSIIHGTKHSMQLERPRLSARLVREFVDGDVNGRAGISEIRPGAGASIDTGSRVVARSWKADER